MGRGGSRFCNGACRRFAKAGCQLAVTKDTLCCMRQLNYNIDDEVRAQNFDSPEECCYKGGEPN